VTFKEPITSKCMPFYAMPVIQGPGGGLRKAVQGAKADGQPATNSTYQELYFFLPDLEFSVKGEHKVIVRLICVDHPPQAVVAITTAIPIKVLPKGTTDVEPVNPKVQYKEVKPKEQHKKENKEQRKKKQHK